MTKYPSQPPKVLFWILRAVVIFTVVALALYDPSLNPDIRNYEYDYILDHSRFEPGYRLSVLASREIGIKFEMFFTIWVVLTCIILILSYNCFYILLISIPNLIYISQPLIGTQIRYAMMLSISMLFISLSRFSSSYFIRLLWAFFSPIFHSAGILISICFILYPIFYNIKRNSRILLIITHLIISAMFLFIIILFFKYIALMIHKSYLIDSDYLSMKSVSSISYILISFLLTSICVISCKNFLDKYVIVGLFFICFSLMFSGYAVIGGRALYIVFLLEPFIMWRMLYIGKKYGNNTLILCGMSLLFLSSAKLLAMDKLNPSLLQFLVGGV